MLLLFALNLVGLTKAADNWQRLPTMDTFANYEVRVTVESMV